MNLEKNDLSFRYVLYIFPLFFTHLFWDLDSMSMDLVKIVLENVCLLLTTHTREIVGSALSFIRMFLTSFPYDTVAPEVAFIVSVLKFLVIVVREVCSL